MFLKKKLNEIYEQTRLNSLALIAVIKFYKDPSKFNEINLSNVLKQLELGVKDLQEQCDKRNINHFPFSF